MGPWVLVMVGLSFTGPGGTSVTSRTDPMPSPQVCAQTLENEKAWYAANRPNARLVYAECLPNQAPVTQQPSVIREWRFDKGPPVYQIEPPAPCNAPQGYTCGGHGAYRRLP